MPYPYDTPAALAQAVQDHWVSEALHQTGPAPHPPHALEILETCFQASLVAEEARSLRFRVALCDPEALEDKQPKRNSPFLLSERRPFVLRELQKLAPAADARHSPIGVWPSDRVLKIWGLLDTGLSWWERVTGQRGLLGIYPPPDCLIASVNGAGSVLASRRYRPLGWLRHGEVFAPSLSALRDGPLADCFAEMGDGLTRASDDEYDPANAAHQKDALWEVVDLVENLLWRVQDLHHGGAILFVPDAWTPHSKPLEGLLDIKYCVADPLTWELFVSSIRKDAELSAARTVETLQAAWPAMLNVGDRVRDRLNLLSSLTAVDGALVLTNRFRVLGFGAVIQNTKGYETVVSAEDPKATKVRKVDPESKGTRHRSAMSLCQGSPDVTALVVSQDGGVTGFRRTGPKVVTMWPGLESSFAF